MSNKKQLAMVLLIMGSANAMDNTGNNPQNTTKNMKNTAKFIPQSPNPQGSKTGSVDQTLRSQQTVSLQPNDLLYNPAHPANERRPVLAQKIMSQEEINKRDVEKQGVEKKLQEKMMSAINEELEDARQEVQNQKAQNQKYREKYRNLRSRIAKLDPNENYEDFLKAFEAIQKEAQEQEAKRETKRDRAHNIMTVIRGRKTFAEKDRKGIQMQPGISAKLAELEKEFHGKYPYRFPQGVTDCNTDSDGLDEFHKQLQALNDWQFIIPKNIEELQKQAAALASAFGRQRDTQMLQLTQETQEQVYQDSYQYAFSMTQDQAYQYSCQYAFYIKQMRESGPYTELQEQGDDSLGKVVAKIVDEDLQFVEGQLDLMKRDFWLEKARGIVTSLVGRKYKSMFVLLSNREPLTLDQALEQNAQYGKMIKNIRESGDYQRLKEKDIDTAIDECLVITEHYLLQRYAEALSKSFSDEGPLTREKVDKYRTRIKNIRESEPYSRMKGTEKGKDLTMINFHLQNVEQGLPIDVKMPDSAIKQISPSSDHKKMDNIPNSEIGKTFNR